MSSTKVTLSTLTLLSLLPSLAFGGSRAQYRAPESAPRGEYSSPFPIVQTHAGQLNKAWKRVEEDWDADYKSLSGSVGIYQGKLNDALGAARAHAKGLEEAQLAATAAQARIDRMNKAIADLDAQLLAGTVTGADRDAQLSTIEGEKQAGVRDLQAARARTVELQSALKDANEAVGQIRGQIAQHMKVSYGQTVDMSKMSAGDLQGQVAAMKDTILRDRMHASIQQTTDQFYDSISDDYMKAGFLVSDMNRLASEYGFVGERLDSIKRTTDKRLMNTLMGGFIHDQIKKAMAQTCGNADYQAACVAGDITKLNGILDGFLRKEPARGVSGQAGKAPALAPAAAPLPGIGRKSGAAD